MKGCACDIPSHAYTYNFALNPDWPRFFSYSPDIFKYLEKVVATFDLRKYMTFSTEVTGCFWNEEEGQWTVKLREIRPGQQPRDFEDSCDLLLHGTGILNNFKWFSESSITLTSPIHADTPVGQIYPGSKINSRAR